jgi:hypothetical protein
LQVAAKEIPGVIGSEELLEAERVLADAEA